MCAHKSRSRHALRSICGEKPRAKGGTRPFKPYMRRGQDNSHPVSLLQSPYSPQLNLIEILWRFMTYTWLPFSAYTSFASLCQAVEQILKQFGTEYRIDFKTV